MNESISGARLGLGPIAGACFAALLGLAPMSTAAGENERLPQTRVATSPILDLVGDRADKNSVGHGNQVALYAGTPSRFFYATHELGPVFSAADGTTLRWFPDHVVVAGPSASAEIIEQRQVCVTRDDVIVAQLWLKNTTDRPLTHTISVTGDCRPSHDWRSKSGGAKHSRRAGDAIVVVDRNVFPELLPAGLHLAVGGDMAPSRVSLQPAGTYRASFDLRLEPGATRGVRLACAVARDEKSALTRLRRVLAQSDPIEENRKEWARFYAEEIPQFTCSEAGLTELYAFRWFLLRFSTAGGDLGYFRYPVVMEGRQAYQTYCCYSAPFMAYDMNWAVDPDVGYGHIASMVHAAYDDGRFPWYTSPRTNRVKIHHRSGTGLSLLPHAAWRHYAIHGDRRVLDELYAGLKRNVDWWIHDRDANGDGLFQVDHPLETGMDDLYRWGAHEADQPYDALDASCYAHLNLSAVAELAAARGDDAEARHYRHYAQRTADAINAELWVPEQHAWFDRDPRTDAPADHYLNVTTFYPLFAGVAEQSHMNVVRTHLLNPEQFWLPYPVPALPKDHPDFDAGGFWRGPSWPAATSHVVQGLAQSAKRVDRTLLPAAGALLRRAARVHLQPRADFFERYNPLTGTPLSTFRDYMHSWWIDAFVRHVAGFEPISTERFAIDPLPLELDSYAMRGVPFRGRRLDILWSRPGAREDGAADPGLTVRVDNALVHRDETFEPGRERAVITLPP